MTTLFQRTVRTFWLSDLSLHIAANPPTGLLTPETLQCKHHEKFRGAFRASQLKIGVLC